MVTRLLLTLLFVAVSLSQPIDVSCAVGNFTTAPLYPQLHVGTSPNTNLSCGLFVPWKAYSSSKMPQDALVATATSTRATLDLSVGLWTTTSQFNATTQANFTLLGYMPHATCRFFGYNSNSQFYNCTLRTLLSYFDVANQSTLVVSLHLPLDTQSASVLSIQESNGSEGWRQWSAFRSICLDAWHPTVSTSSPPTQQQRTFIYPATDAGLFDTPRSIVMCNESNNHIVDIQPVGDVVIVTPSLLTTPTTIITEEQVKLLLAIGLPSIVFILAIFGVAFAPRLYRRARAWWQQLPRSKLTGYQFDQRGESIVDYESIKETTEMHAITVTTFSRKDQSTGGEEENDSEMQEVNLNSERPLLPGRKRLKVEEKPVLPVDTVVLVPGDNDILD